MIRHIVEFRLSATEPEQRILDAQLIREQLTGLVGVVPTVRSVTVAPDLGLVENHWDVVLVTEHDSNADLEAYQSHPAHVEAAKLVAAVVADRATVDYEY